MSEQNKVKSEFVTPKKHSRNKISIHDFTVLSVQGQGSFAKVMQVKKKSNNKIYAMKIIKKSKLHELGLDFTALIERNVLVEVDNPFIVKMSFSFQDQRKLFFVLEYCPGGELWSRIVNQQINEETAKFFTGQIILAIEHLHQNGIVYRDLKPENILIGEDGYIRLTDFGLSYMAKKNSEISIFEAAGTPEYYAPELVAKKKYGKPVDWWCIGAQIFEMLTGLPPFHTENRQNLFAKIRYAEPKYPEALNPIVVNLLKGLLKKNPDQRIGTKKGAEELKNHEWFKDFPWDQLYNKELNLGKMNKPELNNEIDLKYFAPDVIEMELASPIIPLSQISALVGPELYKGFSWYGDESYKPQKLSSGEEDLSNSVSPQLGRSHATEKTDEWEKAFANSFRKRGRLPSELEPNYVISTSEKTCQFRHRAQTMHNSECKPDQEMDCELGLKQMMTQKEMDYEYKEYEHKE